MVFGGFPQLATVSSEVEIFHRACARGVARGEGGWQTGGREHISQLDLSFASLKQRVV